MAKKKMRKVFVLREVQVKFAEVKEGDVFRFDKASAADHVNNEEWNVALSDVILNLKGVESVQCQEIAFVQILAGRAVKFK